MGVLHIKQDMFHVYMAVQLTVDTAHASWKNGWLAFISILTCGSG